jgi:hypothetical protein
MKIWGEVGLPRRERNPPTALGGIRKLKKGFTEIMNLLIPLAEGARFENPETSETIGPDLTSSFRSQSLREEPEVGEEPLRHDRTQ